MSSHSVANWTQIPIGGWLCVLIGRQGNFTAAAPLWDVSQLSEQHTGYVCPTLQLLWAWGMMPSCLHHMSCVALELVTCAGSGCAFCTFSGSSYTVHPAPALGVTRIHSLPFISCIQTAAHCVCWHLGKLLRVSPASVNLAAVTYSLLPLVPPGASHPPIAIPFSFPPTSPFLLPLEYS